MFFDLLDNLFLHHLTFKATQRIFNGLTFVNPNLRHSTPPIATTLSHATFRPQFRHRNWLLYLIDSAAIQAPGTYYQNNPHAIYPFDVGADGKTLSNKRKLAVVGIVNLSWVQRD